MCLYPQEQRPFSDGVLAGTTGEPLRATEQRDASSQLPLLKRHGSFYALRDCLIGGRHPGHHSKPTDQRRHLRMAQRSDEDIHLEFEGLLR